MLTDIAAGAVTDDHASSLLRTGRECAELYLPVAKRQKGCDGMGELAMIKEEFREAVDDLGYYCKEKKYLSKDFDYDLGSVADELTVPQTSNGPAFSRCSVGEDSRSYWDPKLPRRSTELCKASCSKKELILAEI